MSLGSCGIANLAILQLGKLSGGGGKGLSMGWFGLQGKRGEKDPEDRGRKEASKAVIAEMYDEVQAGIDG
ncbi:hypothetical protein Tco_0783497 [Tanacetum coccineum]